MGGESIEMLELCKQIFQFYIKNFLAIFIIVIVVAVPLATIQYGIAMYSYSGMFPAITGYVPWFLLMPICVGALILFVSNKVSGKEPSILSCFQGSLSVWPRLFLVLALVSALTSVGFVLLVVPGVYLLTRLSFQKYIRH